MPRIHLPQDWPYRAKRALRRLNGRGVVAACFWCGHPYRRGECSRETESAHLLQCAEYPQEGKRKIQERKDTKPRPAPQVGIVYFVGGKLFIDATPVAQAVNLGGYVIHGRDHCQYWKQLVKESAAPSGEYDEFPRGRVSFDTKADKFTLLADACILRRKNLVRTILKRMHLAASDTETGTDRLYRCSVCLRRNR